MVGLDEEVSLFEVVVAVAVGVGVVIVVALVIFVLLQRVSSVLVQVSDNVQETYDGRRVAGDNR